MSTTNQRKIVRLTARDGAAEPMHAALIELQRATAKEPGCIEFEFMRSLTRPNAFLLIEDFASPEALETHMQAPHTRAFFAQNLLESGKPIERGWLS